MRDVSSLGERRNHQRGNSGAVSEIVEGLNVAGVIVTAAFVEGDDDGGTLPQLLIGLDAVNDFLHEAFEQVELRRSGVTVEPSVGLHVGNSRQRTVLDRLIEGSRVLIVG